MEVTAMTSSITNGLAIGAVLSGGLLAGTTATRVLVEMPAWERLGALPWAEFSRAENHGIGALFFPLIGLVALLLTIGTAVAFRLDRTMRGTRSLPIYAAVAISLIAAGVTRGAIVPDMYRLRAAGTSAAELQAIFQSISPWWGVNDVLHVMAFGFNLWALIEILSGRQRMSP
jgi:hypothetical protein